MYLLKMAFKAEYLDMWQFHTDTMSSDFINYCSHKYPFIEVYKDGQPVYIKHYKVELNQLNQLNI